MSDYLDDVSSYASLVVDLKKKIDEQNRIIEGLKGQIEIQNQMKIPLGIVRQVAELETKIGKLQSSIKFYKKFVPQQEIENWENRSKPKRGGLSSSLKKNK